MITPLTITSLDQGRALARWQVEKLYAEPAEPAPLVVVEAAAATDTAPSTVAAPVRERQSIVALFLAFLDAALPVGARRI